MKQTKSVFSGLQWGLSVWQGDAPHIGRTMAQQKPTYIVRANTFNREFDRFQEAGADVWTLDGWLVCSITIISNTARCQVRKGKQVATLTTPADDGIFIHNRPDLPNEH